MSWYPHIADLAAHHDVYAVDTIGEPGHSVQTRALETADDLADWLTDLLAGLGHDKVHLVGLSRGGFLALTLAIRRSASTRRSCRAVLTRGAGVGRWGRSSR
ncbi:alpha/beta fold hydrolase [Actinokineospora terrae]|uniref:Alpha/beta hydrolase fold n=1 Tax=Actinokineospora terrae TaxID=155974 RepID=A0A1H9KH37_9PSEU|nr:alpha/beta fold hydrolase [Actinokineospora terrae]SEQ98379.1 alpha/beta hydrolase fold [Actinokineospora terrae]